MAKLWQFQKGHPKPAFFEKVQRGHQKKFFRNRPKSSPHLKGPTALWPKWHYPAPKVPEWPRYGNFRKVTQNPHFLKKWKGGTKGNFSKIARKDALAEKAKKHSGANGIIV